MAEPTSSSTSGVRYPPPLIYVSGLVAGSLLERVVDLPEPGDRWGGVLSLVFLVPGIALVAWSLGLFHRARIDARPWRPTSALTLEGPYRFTRNPMYLGMAVVYVGSALLFELTWALALLPLVLLLVQTQVIAREERYLETTFGDAYRAYRARVRRWL